MKHLFTLFAAALLSMSLAQAATPDGTAPADTARVFDIEEAVIISTPKESGRLRQLPAAVSLLGQQDMTRHNINELKGLSAVVPNLFIPDYGSRLTSAVYIRGVGSRINNPAVGLYVDNVPWFDKSAFDFNFYDIERIDVLRGPQGTLYGRNSMGGIIRINTRNPFDYQGTDLKLGIATRDWHRRASLTHYHRISDRFAFSAGGYYEGSSGFWHNDFRHERQDKLNSGGGRLRGILKPTDRLSLDLSLNYDYTHEGGYPYTYQGSVSESAEDADDTQTPDYTLGRITNNDKTGYTRGMFNGGLNAQWQGQKFILSAVTGFQRLQDRMQMDQDFTSDSLYTLGQRQRLTLLSEELTLRSRGRRTWEWVSGLSLSKQWLTTSSPVNFGASGMNFLENTINGVLDRVHQTTGAPVMAVDLLDRSMPTHNHFRSPVFNAALVHQSTLNVDKHLSMSLGIRLDHEHTSLSYLSEGAMHYDFLLMGMRLPQYQNLTTAPRDEGKLRDDNFEVLPKGAIKYAFDSRNFVYLSAAKGHRSGGYNIQMFSDLLQSAMQTEMMAALRPTGESNSDDAGSNAAVKEAVTYKPEFSWTYEAGTRLALFDNRLSVDGSLFLTTVRDQQISRFVDSGFGRIMVNAGRSRSWGLDLGLRGQATDALMLWLNYGFTRATFTNYDAGDGADYTGNYVPFIPRHTLSAGGDYRIALPCLKNGALTVGASALGAGRIYWTEANNASQPLYLTFGAHTQLEVGSISLNLWGRNLLNKHYHTFYFESMGRAFAQKGNPVQFGLDLTLKF